MVQQALHENPFAGDLFVFRAKRADRVKIWPGTAPVRRRFVWPPVQDGAIRLSAAQLGLLLKGLVAAHLLGFSVGWYRVAADRAVAHSPLGLRTP
jgi:transposase